MTILTVSTLVPNMNQLPTKKNEYLANIVRKNRMQLSIEDYFDKSKTRQKVLDELLAFEPAKQAIEQSVELVKQYLNQEYYQSKTERLKLIPEDIEDLVKSFTVTVAIHAIDEQPIVALAGMCATRFTQMTTDQAYTTAAEILAVMAEANLFDVYKTDRKSPVFIRSNITLDTDVSKSKDPQFITPMVVKPRKVKRNTHSGYLTRHESLILGGKYNHHEENISLDVINKLNNNCYSIDTDFLQLVEEKPSEGQEERFNTEYLDEEMQALIAMEVDNFETYMQQCNQVYDLMISCGNQFYFTNRVDKRGRIYARGYHLNPQGKAYKKALLNLAKTECPSGMPEFLSECTT